MERMANTAPQSLDPGYAAPFPLRPNTVAGLIEKRRELTARLRVASAEARQLTSDIDALDVVIRLFAPEIDGRGLKAKRLPSPFTAKKGEMQRISLAMMRGSDAPITSIMLAERFCSARGLRPDDQTLTSIRNRASIALGRMKARGLVQQVPQAGEYKGWRLAT
jgi:hypothetical protein